MAPRNKYMHATVNQLEIHSGRIWLVQLDGGFDLDWAVEWEHGDPGPGIGEQEIWYRLATRCRRDQNDPWLIAGKQAA